MEAPRDGDRERDETAFAERTKLTVAALLVLKQEMENRDRHQNPEEELRERQRRAGEMLRARRK